MEQEALKKQWEAAGQGQVFRFWAQLNDDQRDSLCKQALSIDVNLVSNVYKKLSNQSEVEKSEETEKRSGSKSVVPLPNVVKLQHITESDRQRWTHVGYKQILDGHVAVLLMAGGQGTRLGCNDPKGMYDVGLLSHKSLFQLQAERILCLQRLVERMFNRPIGSVVIAWYIMTSFVTEVPTKKYFEQHGYFGLDKKNIFFFNQDLFPCVTEEGKILLNSKHEISIAPNGNGGLWSALYSSGALQDMENRNIKIVASYGVDNILAKVADPCFVGFCTEKNTPISCKVVSKAYPEERVGVLCLKDNKPAVIEYSEIDPSQASAVDPLTGDLLYNAAHIVLNNFTLEFIKQTVKPENNKLTGLPYHVAKKKIPCIDEHGNPTELMGWKFEMFVFDVFEFADSLSAFEVVRADEFSPLKNSLQSPADNPRTCRLHLSQLHQKYVRAAGGKIKTTSSQPNSAEQEVKEKEALFEISSLLSYDGEGLEHLVKDQEYVLPYYLKSPQEERN